MNFLVPLIPLLKRRLPPINIMCNGTLDAQLHGMLARAKHLIMELVAVVRNV